MLGPREGGVMKSSDALLVELLKLLVSEWGREKVAATLARMVTDASDEQPPNPKARSARKLAKRSASEQVKKAMFAVEQQSILLQLAAQYDNKEFLPSVSNVREFLIMAGQQPPKMKDRTEAFRILLQTLGQMSVEHLERLANTSLHAGPSKLGPVSEAISAAGHALPRRRHSDSDSPNDG